MVFRKLLALPLAMSVVLCPLGAFAAKGEGAGGLEDPRRLRSPVPAIPQKGKEKHRLKNGKGKSKTGKLKGGKRSSKQKCETFCFHEMMTGGQDDAVIFDKGPFKLHATCDVPEPELEDASSTLVKVFLEVHDEHEDLLVTGYVPGVNLPPFDSPVVDHILPSNTTLTYEWFREFHEGPDEPTANVLWVTTRDGEVSYIETSINAGLHIDGGVLRDFIEDLDCVVAGTLHVSVNKDSDSLPLPPGVPVTPRPTPAPTPAPTIPPVVECPAGGAFEDFEVPVLTSSPAAEGIYPAGWNNAGGNQEWQINRRFTDSIDTGPESARTGSQYMYCESSGLESDVKVCIMDSPAYPSSGVSTIGFYLSRVGATIGTLSVQLAADGSSSFVTVATYTGPEPSLEWIYEKIDISTALTSTSSFQVRLQYVETDSYTADLAIDSFCVY